MVSPLNFFIAVVGIFLFIQSDAIIDRAAERAFERPVGQPPPAWFKLIIRALIGIFVVYQVWLGFQ